MSYNMVMIFRIPMPRIEDISLFCNNAYSLYLKSELTKSVYVYVLLQIHFEPNSHLDIGPL